VIEAFVMLAYFGMMLIPLFINAILEHHASELIEERHHRAVLSCFSKTKAKMLIRH
jgi:hypothetical protein